MPTSWNKLYKQHGRFHLQPHSHFEKFTAILKEHKSKRILDLGCGSGRHLIALAKNGFDTQGIDFSPAAVDTAQKWLKEKGLPGRASIGDIHEEIKMFKAESFDGVLAIDSINYQSFDDFKKSIIEINRLLKKNGILYLVVPSKTSMIYNPSAEQLFFEENVLKKLIAETFEIVEFTKDENDQFVILAMES